MNNEKKYVLLARYIGGLCMQFDVVCDWNGCVQESYLIDKRMIYTTYISGSCMFLFVTEMHDYKRK